MILFVILALLLLVVVLLLLARVIWVTAPKRRVVAATEAQNVAIARERLAELEAAQQRGELSDEEVGQIRHEIEQLLAHDLASSPLSPVGSVAPVSRLATFIGVALFLPLTAGALYQQLGSPEHLLPAEERSAAAAAGQMAPPATMEEMIALLEQKLAQQPQNQEGWFMLGRSYMALENYPKAVAAYEKLLQLTGEQPMALLPLADAAAMAQKGSLLGRPLELINRALAIEPLNATGLWLAGHAADEQGHPQKALELWRQAAAQLSDDSEEMKMIQEQIAAQERQLGLPPTPALVAKVPATAPTPPTSSTESGTAPASIQLTVTLDPALQSRVQPTDTLFIFAKAEKGPPMPLAALKRTVQELPLTVVLDDSLAMAPMARLSNHPQVNLTARISRSGQPTAQSGDLMGEVAAVPTRGSPPMTLSIHTVLP